jgi:hypothetical protein
MQAPAKQDVTQDMGLAAAAKPTMLWIERDGQYKSSDPFVKIARFKTRGKIPSGWT